MSTTIPTPTIHGTPPDPGPPRSPNRLPGVLLAVVGVAAVAATVFGVLWVLALTNGSLHLATDRDTVLVDARMAAVSLNTLDYRDAAGGLDRWEQVSTGTVLDEFRTNHDKYIQFVTQAKRTTKATVSDAAVSSLDQRAGTARVLVGVDVTVTPDRQAPVLTRQRLQLEMKRTDAGWLVDKLAPVRAPGAAG